MDVFLDPTFKTHFERAILDQKWRVADPNLLLDTLETDLRSQPLLICQGLKKRRAQLMPWLQHPDRWGALVSGATSGEGTNRKVLGSLGVLEVFDDFVDHLKCFYAVADIMSQVGYEVIPIGGEVIPKGGEVIPIGGEVIPKGGEVISMGGEVIPIGGDVIPIGGDDFPVSFEGCYPDGQSFYGGVHDIDKLDPVMLAGYAERFTDGVCTSLWTTCVDGHVHRNTHHQGHALWQSDIALMKCDVRLVALREMLCDKVSRRVQKDLGSVLCPGMWDVDPVFFEGLPGGWMDRVTRMVGEVKGAYEMKHPFPHGV